MNSLLKKLYMKNFVRNIFIVVSGTALAQIITFGLIPVITRIYDPSVFGVLGTFTTMINILGPIAALTFPIAIVLPKKNNQSREIMKLALLICISISVISILLLVFSSEFIVEVFNLQLIAPYLFLIPIVIFFSGSRQIIEQWLIRTKQFRVTAKTAVLQSIIVNSSKIGLGIFYPLAASLVFIQTLGIALRGVLMILLSDRSIFNNMKYKTNKQALLTTAIEYKDFPIYRAPQVFFNAISQGLPILLLASFFGPVAAGYYTLGTQAMGAPVQLIGKAVQDVFYPRIAEASNKKEGICKLLIKSVIGLLIVGILPFGAIIAFGPTIFSFIFGSQWIGAGVYAQWIALMSLFVLITRPIIVTIPVLRIQKQFLIFEIMGTLLKVGALVIGFYYFKNDIYAVMLFSITATVLYIILTLYTLLIANKFDNNK